MKRKVLFLIFCILFLNSCAATAVATGLLVTYGMGCGVGEMKTCDPDDSAVTQIVKGLTWPVTEPIKSIHDDIEDYQPKRKNRYMAYSNKNHREGVSRATLRVIEKDMVLQTVSISNNFIQIFVPKDIELKVIDNGIEMVELQSGYGLPIKFFIVENPCDDEDKWKNEKFKDKYLKKISNSSNKYFYFETYTYDAKELGEKIIKSNEMEKTCGR